MTTNQHHDIVIVSGLPRSGTSMMMRMLEAGGIEPVTDNLRKADEDNLRGYYEFEQVKKVKEDQSWLPLCEGKAVKMISMLLVDLPRHRNYKILFMQRNMSEILASQKKMLQRRGEAGAGVNDDKMAQNYEKHLRRIETMLAENYVFDVLYVNYNDVLADPQPHATKINMFLGERLDTAKMVHMVETSLYRQRKNT